MNGKKIFLCAAAVITLLMLPGCGQKVYEYSAEDYVYISVSGLDGKGQASVKFDRQSFYDKLDKDLFDGKALEEELAALEIVYYDLVKINVEGDKENLSNGDTLTVTLSADNEKLKSYRMNITDKPYVYTVSGLEEAVEVDVFEGVSIEYTGISPFADAKAVCDGEYKDDVYYTLDKTSKIKNGDVITVTATPKGSRFNDENLVPIALEKQFTAEGLDRYADEADVDYSELDKFFQGKMDDTIKDGSTYGKDWENDARAFFKDGSYQEKWKVLSCEYTPAKKGIISQSKKYNGYNSYNVFWRLSMEIEKTNDKGNSEYSMEDTANVEIYACTYIPDIIVRSDSSLVYDTDDYVIKTYSTSLFYNYVGADLEEVFEARKGDIPVDFEWIEIE